MPNHKVFNDPTNPLAARLYDNNCFAQSFVQTASTDLRVEGLTAQAAWSFIYNINTTLVNTAITGSGSITQSNSQAVLQTGAAISSSAQVQSRRFSRHMPGLGLHFVGAAIFTAGVSGSTQLIGLGDSNNGLFFGYNGTSFGVMRRQNGTDNWIPKASWNGDKLNGQGLSGITLDTTTGNIYVIKLLWLGFGLITFAVINPSTGLEIVVHRIQNGNTSTTPSVFSPNLPLMALVSNTTNSTNVTLKTPSAAVYLEGEATNANTAFNAVGNNSVSISSNVETNLISLQNKSTVSSITNRVPVKLQALSLYANGGQNVAIRLLRNATLSGTTTYTDIDSTNSVAAYNTAGTYNSGTGIFIVGFQLQKLDTQNYNLVDYDFIIQPTETMTVTALSAGTSSIAATLSWREYY
ncbi:MAG: hypothetical protein ABFD08_13835 [Syntrophomonas sp.]